MRRNTAKMLFAVLIGLALNGVSWAGVPTVRESISVAGHSNTSITCTLPSLATSSNGVANTIVALYRRDSGTVSSISDGQGNTYTNKMAGGTSGVDVWTAPIASSGSDTITLSTGGGPTFQSFYCAEVMYMSTTVDATLTGTWAAGTSITTSNMTSTVGTDIGFCRAGPTNGSALLQSTPAGGQHEIGRDIFVASNSSNDFVFYFLTPGTPSSTVTATWSDDNNGGAGGSYACILFKPASTIEITNDSIPAAAQGTFYTYTLGCAGNVASCSYSVTSGNLPAGVSLSSGGVISGTPGGGTATSNITVQVTDGTNTSTKNFVFNLGRNQSSISNVSCSSSGGSTAIQTALNGVTAGDLIVVGYLRGDQGSAAAASVDNLVFGVITDNIATVYNYINDTDYWYALSRGSSDHLWLYAGIAPSSNNITITLPFNNTLIDVGLFACDFSGAQAFDGLSVLTMGTTSGTGITITSNTLTTPVVNEVLISDAVASAETIGTGSVVVTSPFTSAGTMRSHASFDAGGAGYDIVTSATGYTSSFTANNDTNKTWQIILAAMRPGINGVPFGAHIHHQVQLIGD